MFKSMAIVAVEKHTDFVYVECRNDEPVQITLLMAREGICHAVPFGALWAPEDGGQMFVVKRDGVGGHYRLEGDEMVYIPGLPATSIRAGMERAKRRVHRLAQTMPGSSTAFVSEEVGAAA